MSLKLIREAQAISRLGSKAAEAKALQEALGAASITDVADLFEAFDPSAHQITPEDYQTWMEVLQAEAADRGVDLNKKMNFEDLAHLMFENDPRMDDLGIDDMTKQKIVSAMWSSFKASKAHNSVTRGVDRAIGRAREEEEAAAASEGGFEQALSAAQGVENEERSRPHNLKIQGTGARPPKGVPMKYRKPGVEGEEKAISGWERDAIAASGNSKKNPYQPGSLRHSLWNDVHGVEEEEMEVVVGQRPSLSLGDLASTERTSIPGEEGVPGDSDVEQRIDDLEARVSDIEAGEAEEPWHQDDAVDSDEDLDGEFADDEDLDVNFGGSDNERKPARVTIEDEETVKKNMFRNVITAPRSEVTQALKDVESEGQKAWAGMQLAKNPHPKKSQAYNAWQKGFRNSAKDSLGIVDKPVNAKPAKRK